MTISPGEKRRRKAKREREDAVLRVIMAGLRAAGASCGTCKHFSPYPGPGKDGQHICEMTSDYQGYTMATADGLCVDHPLAKELVKP